jgi:YegS/Rv2252/BmrU family lipid kinase
MRKKIIFVVNPNSGTGRHKGIEKLIMSTIDAGRFDAEIMMTHAPGHAVDIGRQAVESDAYAVVAVGGDGSVNELSRHVIGSETLLGIIPAGSGNGLASHLQIPSDFKKAIEVINSGKTLCMDTARINDMPFLGVAGFGFDAVISHEFARYGSRGFITYVKVTIREYLGYKPRVYAMSINGKEYLRKALLVCLANSSQYGNNAFIAPDASVNDGLLNICIMKKVSIWNVPLMVYQLFSKKLNRSRFMETVPASDFSMQIGAEPLCMHVDGEPVMLEGELKVMIKPASLHVIVP